MGDFADRQRRLQKTFQSIVNWVDDRLSARDDAFLRTLREYVVESQRLLAKARKERDLTQLERRATKATAATISYVQNALKDPKMGEQ
jgi:hypothetical protein